MKRLGKRLVAKQYDRSVETAGDASISSCNAIHRLLHAISSLDR